MLQVCVQILVIMQVLGASKCQDLKQFDEDITLPATITAESIEIVDCFTEAANMSRHFSDEEPSNISHFQNITHHPCDRNSSGIFQCNYPLIDHLNKAEYLASESRLKEIEFYNSELFKINGVEHYKKATELQRQATQVMTDLISQIRQIKQEVEARNEFKKFTDNCSLMLLNMDNLLSQSLQYATVYKEMAIRMEILLFRTNTLQYYFPPFIAAVFIFGMVGNGLLLLIFARHPKTRMGPNVMLVNLAVTDTLHLLVNILIPYCKQLWGFPFGIEACYIYRFVRNLITAASVYSMTILSFSRYIAVTAKPGNSSNRLTSMPVMLTSVWILSAVVGIPDTLTSKLEDLTKDCSGDLSNTICEFFTISLLPLTAITCFYIAASRRLRKSVRMMPGQALGQEKVKLARERGAKILPGLIFVFAIKFLPFYTYFAIVTLFRIDIGESLTVYTLHFIVYFLYTLNSAINPVALYLTSDMFRKYINNYITLGLIKKETSPAGSDKSYAVSSKL